ncbi:hypothetical protein L1987_10589 [Smallanthus sonchifolius]|uniref:Uncharacterized protein n=1 Tax=Smallanthus sonchifolius TaxID=185202 RepID=A0ACB9JSH1_9ASTR|nr:hypothetical protein L1987_10589 [Smallanthus sonchifolius]
MPNPQILAQELLTWKLSICQIFAMSTSLFKDYAFIPVPRYTWFGGVQSVFLKIVSLLEPYVVLDAVNKASKIATSLDAFVGYFAGASNVEMTNGQVKMGVVPLYAVRHAEPTNTSTMAADVEAVKLSNLCHVNFPF